MASRIESEVVAESVPIARPAALILLSGASVTALACALVALVGCMPQKSSPEQLQARLQSATLIVNDWTRDLALNTIATDAAKSGQANICTEAVDEIQSILLHDNTVATCAKQFTTDGKQWEAEMLAIRATDDNLRDQVLAVLAKFSPPAASKPAASANASK